MTHPTPTPAAERQRRSNALRKQGGLVAPVTLNKDQLDMLIAGGWLDMEEVEAVRDDARRYARLYAQACGAAIGRILDGLSENRLRVRSKSPEPK